MITLVAVHGNGGGGFRFARVLPHVRDDIRFEAVTLPGFGGRPGDPALRTLPDYAEALWREIEQLPRPIVVLGHGIGGSIALDMVQRHEIDGLILHAPVGTRLEQRWFPRLMKPEPVRSLIKWGISSRLTRPLIGRRFFSRDVPAGYRNQFLDEYGRADSFSQMFDIITADWWDGLQPVELPSLMLWGSDDRVLGADQVADYRALLPQASTDVVPGWGHFPMVEGPAEYAAVITDWAERLVAGRPAPLRVGSGLLADEGIGPKAALLDRAASAGLPVPPAVVLTPSMLARSETPMVADRVAVRSAFSSEDGDTNSNAGRYATVLDVDGADPDAFDAAMRDVRTSADDGVARADVLVMQMVPAVVAGVAFSEYGWQDDLVEWADGVADGLVGGSRQGELVQLPRLVGREHLDAEHPAWQGRLGTLLRDVRRVFGDVRWDVEWADDGERCWLVQIRPVTMSPLRNETFTIANHREILPDPPSVFMTSLIADGSPELFDYYRRFDPTLSTDRVFIEVFDGRPLINLSLMVDFMRSLGLPTKLVTDSIGGTDDRGTGLRPARLVRRLPVLARLGLAQAGALHFADDRAATMVLDNAGPTATFADAVDRARRNYVATVHAMTALNTAASLPTSLLRSLGVLEQHAARTETAATQMFRELDMVRRTLPDDALATTIDPTSFGPTSTAAWQRWLDAHGHRGIYESDLSRPRYVEQPAPVLSALRSPLDERTPPRRSLLGVLTWPIWLAARRPMAARERFRSDAMRSFLAVRRELLRHAENAGVSAEALWLSTTDEVTRLDDGWRPDGAVLDERRADTERRRSNPIPEVISRFDPVDRGSTRPGHGEARSEFNGIGLVAERVEGRAWVLNEPAHELPDGFDRATTILVAPSVDPGWLSTFGLVAGVAVELGGDLSHGSIVLRELGLPAVTNVSGLIADIDTGDRIEVDGRHGAVRLLA